MTNDLTPFIIPPKTLSEGMELAKIISQGSFCPSSMRGKPGDVMLALQMGIEVGLSYMQALQNIAVINGKPCLYGDGALAVAMASPMYEYHKEWLEGDINDGSLTAYCLVKRKGAEEYTKTFSIADAKTAGLWKKAGPWTTYPSRMLQMRARAFAIRDQFADALRGISIREEVEDYQPIERQAKVIESSKPKVVNIVGETIVADVVEVVEEPKKTLAEIDTKDIDAHNNKILSARNEDELKEAFTEATRKYKGYNLVLEDFVWKKDFRKEELLNMAKEQEKCDAAFKERKVQENN